MAENIKLPSEALTAETPASDCKICLTKPSRYTCPRCNIRYCSSECYKSQAHAQCSETFYRDCFMEGLKEMRPEGKEQMMEILKRQAEQESDPAAEADDIEDLAERLEGIDIDNDTQAVWERLTEAERAQFQSLLRAGELGKFIEPWEAWWDKRVLVSETDAQDPYPIIMPQIPDLSSIMGGKTPSELVQYSIINVLYGYCYMCRLYNGDCVAFRDDICEGLLELCAGLGQRQLSSPSDAIHSCLLVLSGSTKTDLSVSVAFSTAVIQDVCKIINGDMTWKLAALSDLHSLFSGASKHIKKQTKNVDKSKEVYKKVQEKRQRYFVTLKKIEFLLSYVKDHGRKLSELLPDLEVEYCTLASTLARPTKDQVHGETKTETETDVDPKASKTLVEELN